MKLNRIAAISIAGVLAVCAVGTAPVAAKKVTKPDVPTIIRISSKKVKTKVQNLTVMLEKPANNGGSPVIDMTVQVLKQKCVIKGSASSCTIKNIPLHYVSNPAIVFWARNKVGTSSKTTYRSYSFRYATWVRAGYTASGKKFPSIAYKRERTRVLAGGSAKWSKFQAIRRSRVSSSGLRQRVPGTGTPAVTFTVTNVIGLALPDSSSQRPTSGMYAVNADGTTVDSLMPGSLAAAVRDFYSAPNGRFYVTFVSATALVQGGPTCVLAEVDATTGIPTCVDSTISNVALTGMAGSYDQSAPVQFDDAGNIYYTGTMNGKFVLRKSVNGVVTSLINDNIWMQSFVVMGDGSVLINGTTTSSSTQWFRKVSPTNSLSSLVPQSSRVNFVKKFPDGNVYFGLDQGGNGVRRYLAASGTVDPRYWIGYPGSDGDSNAYNLFSIFFTKVAGVVSAPRPSSVERLATSAGGHVVGVLGCCNTGGALYHFYPSPQRGNTALVKITSLLAIGNKFVLAGEDENGTNMLTLYDPATFQETVIIDSSNEVEVYSVGYVESSNKLIFNGLRFSDNQVVIGEVDLAGL